MGKINSLSELTHEILGDSLVYADRGNGCGGAGYEDATDVYNKFEREEREDEDLTSVSENDDAEAWELARDAFRDLGLNPAEISAVYVGERVTEENGRSVPNGHQMIYAI